MFSLYPPGYSVAAQARKLGHETNAYFKKFGFNKNWKKKQDFQNEDK